MPATDAGTFASLPIELAIENRQNERVGLVLRTPAERCVVLTRGSMLVCSRWPSRTADFAKVASLLVLSQIDHKGLPMLIDATAFDSFGVFVLQEAAAEVGVEKQRP